MNKITRKNFKVALVENGRHYDTHLVNNDRETDSFFIEVLVTMMCEDPKEHKLIRKAKF